VKIKIDELFYLPVLQEVVFGRAFHPEVFGSCVSIGRQPDVVRRPLRKHRLAEKKIRGVH
jgi:hypothetical protein